MPDEMKIGVVILNYNGWKDTLECVESVLASSVPPMWVVLVDNASPNESVACLRRWAEGGLDLELHRLNIQHPCPKPLQLTDIPPHSTTESPTSGVILVRSAENKGYAAGNNHGIRLLMQWGADAVWILNNDTRVEPQALAALRDRLFALPRPGLCGGRIVYTDTNRIQCRAGGITQPWTALSRLDGHLQPVDDAQTSEVVEKRINFIYGACVMASRDFINTVGLMDERFFLYCEEQDWSYSAKNRFDFGYASEAVVFHKEGSSIGTSSRRVNLRSLWYMSRSRILVTAKHVPWALPVVCLSIAFAAVRMAWRRLVVTSTTTC